MINEIKESVKHVQTIGWSGFPNRDISYKWITYLLDELEKAWSSKNDMWECPDCGFRFDACHVDVDEKGNETGECTCPLCAEEELTKENERLRTEHTAMKEALEQLSRTIPIINDMSESDSMRHNAQSMCQHMIKNALSTLTNPCTP